MKNSDQNEETVSQKNTEVGTPRQQKFVAGILAGKSMKVAAIEAGYSEQTASSAGRDILPRVRRLFAHMLDAHIPLNEQAELVAQGMKATKVQYFQKDGIVTDERTVIDWQARSSFLRLGADIQGLVPERKDEANSEPVAFSVNVTLAELPNHPRALRPGQPMPALTVSSEVNDNAKTK